MEAQEELEKSIGTLEPETLKPTKVKIVKVELKEIGPKKIKKLVCTCKHPDKEETIEISRVRYIVKDDKLATVGLWYKEDKEGNLQKGTALASFVVWSEAMNMKQLESKEVETVAEDTGYLCFKAY